jgi:pantoate--beta-alanine ligase
MTEILRTADQVRERVSALRSRGQKLALVPTMGYLHEGHLSLMREGKRRAEVCAASLFVNPRQFGPNEDLGRYPRDEDGDLEKCRRAGGD